MPISGRAIAKEIKRLQPPGPGTMVRFATLGNLVVAGSDNLTPTEKILIAQAWVEANGLRDHQIVRDLEIKFPDNWRANS